MCWITASIRMCCVGLWGVVPWRAVQRSGVPCREMACCAVTCRDGLDNNINKDVLGRGVMWGAVA